MPWISFCISTYKRPDLLRTQLQRISQQTFGDFEVIVSDNDPDCTARVVVEEFDQRFRYFSNEKNIGMVPSFNKSIARSGGDYILMVTDDDFIDDIDHGLKLKSVHDKNPGHSIYLNCIRKGKSPGEIEFCDKENFVYQLLNPSIVERFFWSDCILKSAVAKEAGGLPDYGSPHLADHALLALCGKDSGGVFINWPSSKHYYHELNFSKTNLDLYYKACHEFYDLISRKFSETQLIKQENALVNHLYNWAKLCIFSLRNYNLRKKDVKKMAEVKKMSADIFQLSFMRPYQRRFKTELFVHNLQNLKKYLKYNFLLATGVIGKNSGTHK